jgi:hypothetical protein
MNRKLIGRETVASERRNRFRGDARRSPPPAGVKERHDARGVRDEDRDAVSYSDCKRNSLLGGDVPICFFARAEPTFPSAEVDEDPRPMNLPEGNKSPGGL